MNPPAEKYPTQPTKSHITLLVLVENLGFEGGGVPSSAHDLSFVHAITSLVHVICGSAERQSKTTVLIAGPLGVLIGEKMQMTGWDNGI